MRNTIIIILSLFSILLFNSCREDGDWGKDNDGQFGFTIERDDNFIEKSVGETNQLKFNIKTNYDFASVPTTFKFTTNLNGVLSLNGKTLIANQEYAFSTNDNIFEYVGNVAGTHQLKIIVKNSKGASKEEEFELKYGVSEFSHTYTGGTAPIYQGDETNYLMKIVPGSGQSNTGYQIKFNTYEGTIKLNGVTAQLGQFYELPNIDNFSITTATNKSGNGALFYTIKNTTVSKDYSIQQKIIAREITVESMNISKLSTAPNTPLSLIGVVKKTPITDNSIVQYKTWISSASNNNTSGIQNTSNMYIPYTLGANGSFAYNFNALQVGTYTYNIQFKDEYGNESTVSTFNIVVENTLSITTPPTVSVNLVRTVSSAGSNVYDIRHKYNGAILNVAATTSANNGISKIIFEFNFNYDGQTISKTYTTDYNTFPTTVNMNYFNTNDPYQLNSYIGYFSNAYPINAGNGTFKVYVYDKFNDVISETGDVIVNIN